MVGGQGMGNGAHVQYRVEMDVNQGTVLAITLPQCSVVKTALALITNAGSVIYETVLVSNRILYQNSICNVFCLKCANVCT